MTLLPPRSGGALGRRGPLWIAQCAIGTRGRKMSVEAFFSNTKECVPIPPSHCAKRANSVHTCRPQVSPTKSSDLKIKERCVHPGSKAPSFARWADNGPLCLKHTGNLAHFSCKCPTGKRYKRWETTIEGCAISAICETATCKSTTTTTTAKKKKWKTQPERNRYLRFVSTRNVTSVMDPDALRYLFFFCLQFFHCHYS